MRFEEFQDGHLGVILAILNLYVALMPPIKFGLRFGMRMPFEEFKDGCSGGQLGCLKEFSSSKSSCLPPSFSLIRSRADVVSRFSSWPPWQPSWILEWKEFSNSKSPCHPNACHQIRAQSDLPYTSRRDLKMSTVAAFLDIGTKRF